MDLSAEFRKVDTDDSGQITADELRHLMENCCHDDKPRYDDLLINAFIQSCDKDGDGQINFSEFMYFMANELC